jgi:hypothetical protein
VVAPALAMAAMLEARKAGAREAWVAAFLAGRMAAQKEKAVVVRKEAARQAVEAAEAVEAVEAAASARRAACRQCSQHWGSQ